MEEWQREMHEAAEKLKMASTGSALGSKRRREEPHISQAPGFEQFCKVIGSKISDTVKPLQARIAELETQVRELQSRPQMKYCGVWCENTWYFTGSVVTHKGSMWHADHQTQDKPPSPNWTQCVKRGKDGQDKTINGNGAEQHLRLPTLSRSP